MSAKRFKFTEEQKANVKAAIEDLENHSSGEIVPYFTYKSDSYEEAKWKCAIILSLLGAIMLGAASYFWLLPFAVTPLEDAAYILVLMAVGFFIPIVYPPILRTLVTDERMNQRVMEQAMSIFLEYEIFKTRDRTGVLIYISELEHEVVVLADSGINAKVTPEEWEHVTALVVDGIKHKEVDKGLVEAIKACKTLLLDNGFTVRPDDDNELSDDLIIG